MTDMPNPHQERKLKLTDELPSRVIDAPSSGNIPVSPSSVIPGARSGVLKAITVLALTLGGGWYAADRLSPRPNLNTRPKPVQREYYTDLSGVSYDREADYGPFAFDFLPGQSLHYTLDGRAEGFGTSLGDESPIGLDLSFDLSLDTVGVDEDGNAKLRMTFDEVSMLGDFMGSPVDLLRSGDTTYAQLNERDIIDTALGDSIQGIPQLEFFDSPVEMVVSPSGEVLSVNGPPGFDQIVNPVSMVSPVTYPEGDLEEGDEWISEFMLPVPGLAAPSNASARNTFEGYEDVNGYWCGVIRQEMMSIQTDGKMLSPGSALGDEMNFSMPTFEVRGTNYIYFDTESGKLIQTDFDMEFVLELGEELKAAAQAVSGYNELLDDAEGPKKRPKDHYEDGSSLLDMGVKIKATLALVE